MAILRCVFSTDTDTAVFDEAIGGCIRFISSVSLELIMLTLLKNGRQLYLNASKNTPRGQVLQYYNCSLHFADTLKLLNYPTDKRIENF